MPPTGWPARRLAPRLPLGAPPARSIERATKRVALPSLLAPGASAETGIGDAQVTHVLGLEGSLMQRQVIPEPLPAELDALLGHARSVVGDALLGAVLFGSWARGQAYLDSDVDVLLIVDRSIELGRDMYYHWDAKELHWHGHPVDGHFAHLYRSDRLSGLWGELALDGSVLFERDGVVSAELARIRRLIGAGRWVRQIADNEPYWMEAA